MTCDKHKHMFVDNCKQCLDNFDKFAKDSEKAEYKVGTVVGLREPEGIIVRTYPSASKQAEEMRRLLLGPPIDVLFFKGRFKGILLTEQDSCVYKIFDMD